MRRIHRVHSHNVAQSTSCLLYFITVLTTVHYYCTVVLTFLQITCAMRYSTDVALSATLLLSPSLRSRDSKCASTCHSHSKHASSCHCRRITRAVYTVRSHASLHLRPRSQVRTCWSYVNTYIQSHADICIVQDNALQDNALQDNAHKHAASVRYAACVTDAA